MRTALSILLASSALALAACGDDDSTTSAADATPPATTTDSTASTPAETTPAEDAASTGDAKCKTVEAPKQKSTDTPEPKGKLDASKKNIITLQTSCGNITIELAAKEYPKTANAVATLVKNGYWDNTQFHRIIPGFVIQGGDPTGTGTGGPSWKVVEAPKSTETYPEGTLAMAKTGNDAPGTTQSQFFIMVGSGLDPQYAVAGKVTSGMNVAKAIEAQGDPSGSGTPTAVATIIKATFKAE
ncbi:MAG: peptidylprolyl isomerase [Solirubrobacteraceae bacterium]|nr:peptidylprolyl isomerase [Solirubrobacteraceae bacterium]